MDLPAIDLPALSRILLTGFVSALFTGILAFGARSIIQRWLDRSLEEFKAELRQVAFERQSWWELKKASYSAIMNSLVNLQSCLEGRLDHHYEKRVLDAESKTELDAAYLQAKEHLKTVALTGAYIVSEDTIVALRELLHGLNKYQYYNSMMADIVATMHVHHSEVKSCKARIREYAKADLLEH